MHFDGDVGKEKVYFSVNLFNIRFSLGLNAHGKMIRPIARFGMNFLRYGQSLGLNRLMPPSKMNVSRSTYAETYI